MTNNSSWYQDMFGAQGQRRRPTAPTNPNTFTQTNPDVGRPAQDMSPFYGTAFQGDDGTRYRPAGNEEWEPENQIYLAENQAWDYRNPPVGKDGRPLGMNNEPLPTGAAGWTPQGEPDFGPGLEGWWKAALYDVYDNPEKNTVKALNYLETQKNFWRNLAQGKPLEAVQTSLGFWQDALSNLSSLGSEKSYDAQGNLLESRPTQLTYLSRWIGEGLQGIGQGLDVAAQTVESVGGTVAGTLQDLGEGSPMPEFTRESDLAKSLGLQNETGEWRLPNPFTKGETSWDLGWVQTLSNITPHGIMWNAVRALTAPKKSWDEVTDTFAENWQASRIAYSALNDEALKQEFISRYKAGEDPRLLAMELGQPWQELAGKFVADPLNLLGGDAKKGLDLIDNAEDVFKPLPEIQNVLDTLRTAPTLTDAGGTQKLEELVAATIEATRTRMDDLAKSAKVFGSTATGKRANTLKRVGLTLDNVIGASLRADGTLDTEKVIDQLDNMIKLVSEDEGKVALALGDILGGSKKHAYDAGALLSPAGQETGLVLSRLLRDEEGVVDAEKFVGQLVEAQKAGSAAVADLVNKKLAGTLEEIFPTTLERVAAIEDLKDIQAGVKTAEGVDVTRLERIAALGNPGYLAPFFARVHKTSRPVYNLVNGLLSGVYMGLSPGYAFRNAIGNNFQTFVDLGIGAWKKFNPDEMAELGFRWGEEFRANRALGGISSAAAAEGITALKTPVEAKGFIQGFMDALKGGDDLTLIEKYGQPMLRVGEWFESNAAKRIVGYAIDRAMMILTPKAVPIGELTRIAGLSTEQANTFQKLVLRYNGDLEAAFKGLRSVENFSLKAVLLNGLAENDIQILKDYDIWNDFVKSLEDVGSRDHLFNAMDDAIAQLQDIAKSTKTEHVMGAGDDAFEQVIQAAKVPDNTKALNANKYTANSQTWKEYRRAANLVFEETYRNYLDAGQPLDKLVGLRDEYADWMTGVRENVVFQNGTQFRENFISALDVLDNGRPNLGNLWNRMGLPGEMPQGFTRKEFRAAAWDYYFSTQNERWINYRDELAIQMETFLKRFQELEPNANLKLIEQARTYYAEAQALDDAQMATRGGSQVMITMQEHMQDLIREGKNTDAARVLASRYGVPSATAKGAPNDAYLVNIVKKYGQPGSVTPLSRTNILVPTKQMAPEVSAMVRGTAEELMGELKASGGVKILQDLRIRMSENPKWYRELERSVQRRQSFFKAFERIANGTDDLNTAYVERAKQLIFDRLAQFETSYPGSMGSAFAEKTKLGDFTLDEIHAALEAWNTSKGGMPKISNVWDWLIGATEEVEQGGEIVKTAKVLTPPAGPGVASLPRTLKESLPSLRQYLNTLKGKLDENWGNYVGGTLTKEQELALSDYLRNVAKPKMQEARRLAGAVAEAQRKFTILDYADRTNFDLALSMVMPYHFWYSRTYGNWMKRFMQNPKLLADYARYRETLEQIHAGAPEWYKYQVNTNELLGVDMQNPWYWNLEATLNPLNGMTGVDFSDPDKRVNWWTRTLDDVSKFGPSVWTPFTLATGYALYNMGQKDAAARWGGRLIPQTATLKAVASLANIRLPFSTQYNELDPVVNLFSEGLGLDPYEQRRVSRALGTLADLGQITEEQAIEAAWSQKGDVYDQAVNYALDQRAIPQLQSYLMGVGFKGRTQSDIQIDQMYREYTNLWNMAPNLAPDEFRQQMEMMRVKYPWMDAVILAKKSGPERDRALAYNVLSRVPPGQSGDILELFGLNDAQMQMFYDRKGDLSYMTETDRARFMAGVVELGAALALPADATRVEWAEVRNRYTAMQTAAEQQFGPEIWDRVGDYFMLQKSNPDAAKLFMANNPLVEQALSWRENAVMNDPLLFDYYGGLDFLDKYWTGQMYDAAQKQFGTGIFEVSAQYGQLADQEAELLQQYYDLKDAGQDAEAKAFRAAWLDKDSNQKDLYLAAHPELKAYWDLKKSYQEEIQRRLVLFEDKIRDVRPDLREDYQPQGVYEIPAAAQLGYQFPEPPTFQDYAAMMTPAQLRLFEDYVQSGDLSPTLRRSLETMAEQQGMSYQELLSLIEQAFYQEVATTQ